MIGAERSYAFGLEVGLILDIAGDLVEEHGEGDEVCSANIPLRLPGPWVEIEGRTEMTIRPRRSQGAEILREAVMSRKHLRPLRFRRGRNERLRS